MRSLPHSCLIPLVVVALLAGCQGEPLHDVMRDEEAFPEEGGTLFRRLSSEPATLNFVKSTTLDEKYVLSLLYDPLVEWNDELELVPGIAASWEISPDLRRYTFRLDPRATWSDGTRVTASDVIFTLNRIVDPERPSPQYAGLFDALDMRRSKAIDDATVEIWFRTGHAGTLTSFNIPVLPRHIYENDDEPERPVGSGPYVLTNRERGRSLTLERRDDYWRRSPYIENVVFVVLEEDATAWNALKLGEIDVTAVSSDRWVNERNLPSVARMIDFYLFYELEYSFIAWNNRHPLLSDPRVRRAMTMSLDRRAIIETMYHGTARVITGPYTPDQQAYSPEVDAIRYDLESAAALLREAGITDRDGDGWRDHGGTTASVSLLVSAGSDISRQIGEILQDALGQIGFRLELEVLDRGSFFGRVIEGDFDGAFLAWGIDPDPDVYSIFHSSQTPPVGQNFVFYTNPEVDSLLVRARSEFDPGARTAMYNRIHKLLAADQPYTWVVQEKKKFAVNKRVRNVEIGRGIGLFLWYPGTHQWWIPAEMRRVSQPEDEEAVAVE